MGKLVSVTKKIFTGSVLSDSKVMRRLPVFAFIGLLMLVYMAIGFNIHKRHSELDELKDELTLLRTISVTTSATRQEMTQRSNIKKLLKKHNIDLKSDTAPPHIIEF